MNTVNTAIDGTKLTAKQQSILALANKIKSFGYDVYLSGTKDYGFFTNSDGIRLVSFQIDYFFFNFSSNHKSIGLGSGARITNDEQCIEWEIDKWCNADFLNGLMTVRPYTSRRKNEKFVSWTTLQQHLETYQSSSKYSKL